MGGGGGYFATLLNILQLRSTKRPDPQQKWWKPGSTRLVWGARPTCPSTVHTGVALRSWFKTEDVPGPGSVPFGSKTGSKIF